MDVSQKIDAQTKARLVSLQIECQVLQNLLTERNAVLNELVQKVLMSLAANPTQYSLKMNSAQDKWELVLNPNALILPGMNPEINRAARRAIAKN